MAITLTTDPIVDEQTVRDLLGWTNANEIRLHINGVSARFLAFTNRKRITSGAVTEYLRGMGLDIFWAHATPVTSVTSLDVLSNGDSVQSLTAADYEYVGETGKFYLHGTTVEDTGEDNIKLVYTGGWSTVPGDIVQSALALMKLDKERAVGVRSSSHDGVSTTYDTDDLPPAVKQVWSRYRVLI